MNTCRILDRLWEAERCEPDIHLRSDYRQAFITVSLASKGNTEPFLSASYAVYGIAPEKVWPRIMADRKAKLGKEFADWFDVAGILKPDIPKKTSLPVTPHPDEQVPARLAAVLMFPKLEVQRADVEQAGSLRRSKKSKGNLYEMPAASRSAQHQPLRILPA
jgi:hypothetical protein